MEDLVLVTIFLLMFFREFQNMLYIFGAEDMTWHKNLGHLLYINIFPRVQKRYPFFDPSTLTKTKT